MINAHIDIPELGYSEQEIAAAKREIAAEKWQDLDEDAQAFLIDHAAVYIVDLVSGGSRAAQTLMEAERDTVGYLAKYVPTAKAIRRLRP